MTGTEVASGEVSLLDKRRGEKNTGKNSTSQSLVHGQNSLNEDKNRGNS